MSQTDPVLVAYLNRLGAALGNVNSSDRNELLDRVREHYDAASRDLSHPTEEQRANILRKLGDPELVAREMFDVAHAAEPEMATFAGTTWTAITLALVWPVGIIGLATRALPSVRERLLLAALAVVGPILGASTTFSPAAFVPDGTGALRLVAAALWSPMTVTGLMAALVLVWRHSQLSGTPSTFTSNKALGVMVGLLIAWIVLAFLARLV
jgi:uncharacterized membrane protein